MLLFIIRPSVYKKKRQTGKKSNDVMSNSLVMQRKKKGVFYL